MIKWYCSKCKDYTETMRSRKMNKRNRTKLLCRDCFSVIPDETNRKIFP